MARKRKTIRLKELEYILSKLHNILNPNVDLKEMFIVGTLVTKQDGEINGVFIQKDALLNSLQEWGLEK